MYKMNNKKEDLCYGRKYHWIGEASGRAKRENFG
jgi:hypothetical protein